MLPSIWPDDVLVFRRRKIDQVIPGETALFSRHGRLVSHRVISHDGTFLVTQGDSAPKPDLPVAESELLGTVTEIVRRGKRVSPSPSLSLPGKITAALVRRCWPVSRILQRAYALRCRGFYRRYRVCEEVDRIVDWKSHPRYDEV
jgi:hypothetical protein